MFLEHGCFRIACMYPCRVWILDSRAKSGVATGFLLVVLRIKPGSPTCKVCAQDIELSVSPMKSS